MRPKVICILGPTASGKTDLAIRLTQDYPMDIISVDSAMVYRGMDVGTAKPTSDELQRAPHRLINICDPNENYSAGQFCQDALREIHAILQNKRIPLLVGGTMLYFHLLQQGFSEFPGADLNIRKAIEEQAQIVGWEKLHSELSVIDPEAAAHIHPHDKQRISRALELFHSTGKTLTELQKEQHWQEWPFEFINIILSPVERKKLHERIEKRLDQMLEKGLIEEVKELYQRGDLNPELPSIRLVGYRQVWAYLAGEYDYVEMRQRAIFATRQFAKRQLTWLRQWTNAERFNSDDPDLYQQVCFFLKGL